MTIDIRRCGCCRVVAAGQRSDPTPIAQRSVVLRPEAASRTPTPERPATWKITSAPASYSRPATSRAPAGASSGCRYPKSVRYTARISSVGVDGLDAGLEPGPVLLLVVTGRTGTEKADGAGFRGRGGGDTGEEPGLLLRPLMAGDVGEPVELGAFVVREHVASARIEVIGRGHVAPCRRRGSRDRCRSQRGRWRRSWSHDRRRSTSRSKSRSARTKPCSYSVAASPAAESFEVTTAICAVLSVPAAAITATIAPAAIAATAAPSANARRRARRRNRACSAHALDLVGVGFVATPERVIEELSLGRREPHGRRRPPVLELLETAPREQVVVITTGGQPVVDGEGVGGVLTKVVAPVVDPPAQALPLTEQRLVGDLQRECTRQRVAVADQQPIRDERLDRPVHGDDVDVEGDQFRCRHDAAGVGVAAHGDQPQEQLAGRFSLLVIQGLVERFGPTGHGPPDAHPAPRRPPG